MLPYEIQLPPTPEDGAPLVVLLHGRGSDRHDLARLHPFLPSGMILVTPEAPFPAAPWGYGPGSAWYRLVRDGVPDESSFAASQEELGEFLAALPTRLPVRPGPLVLGGFSQGGTMSLSHAVMHPGQVPFVVNLSGFVPEHPAVAVSHESVKGTAVFWGHGTQDTAVPYALAVRGREALRAAEADLEARDYDMGHSVSPAELRDLAAWLTARIAQGVGP